MRGCEIARPRVVVVPPPRVIAVRRARHRLSRQRWLGRQQRGRQHTHATGALLAALALMAGEDRAHERPTAHVADLRNSAIHSTPIALYIA